MELISNIKFQILNIKYWSRAKLYICYLIFAILNLNLIGCGLVDADRGINMTIENLSGPYNVDLAYTDDDGDASTPTKLNTIPDLSFTLGTNLKVSSNPGFSGLLDGTSTAFSDYYITGYTITYTLIDTEITSPGTITENVGGLGIHIQNGETFSGAAANIQVVSTATRERLISTFGTTGSFDVLATITFKGYTEDSRTFNVSGSFDIKFDEFAPS